MCEVLAPAGDEAAFYAAINSGANAVYLGLTDFSARKSAANFSLDNLKGYIDHAHALGVRVHVALNTLVKEGETDRFFESVLGAWNAGADALIIQDIFLGKRIKQSYPEMTLHLSTQAGVCNLYGARLAKRCGFSRVILARETPIESVAAIAKEIETEVFVQGALCTCFSGQCYLSAFIGGNSGNRGFCKQPCRKKYEIDREGFGALSYKLSLSDLSVGEDVKKLAAAGVASFKIEGRMRSAAYVGAAVRYYRDILDGKGDLRADLSDLKRAFNRGDYTKGYFFGQDKNLISSAVQGHKGEKIGEIAKDKRFGKLAFVRSSYVPSPGDGFKVIRGNTEVGGGSYSAGLAKAAGGFYLPADAKYREGDGVYLTLDTSLSERVADRRRSVPVSMSVKIEEGKRPHAIAEGKFGAKEYFADFVAERAKTRAIAFEEVAQCFAKADAYPFSVTVKNVEIGGSPFVVKSALNAFRREVYARLYRELAGERACLASREIGKKSAKISAPEFTTAVISEDFSFAKDVGDKIGAAVFAPKNYKNTDEIDGFFEISKYYAWHKWLYLPAFMTDEDIKAVQKSLGRFDGAYAEGAWAAELCRECGVKLFAGTGFNLFNTSSLSALAEEDAFSAAAISKELSQKECAVFENVFRFAGGAIKVMELGHCPFGRSCLGCERKDVYSMTDEQGRVFPLRRYEASCCRFELFNCAPLAPQAARYALYDLRTLSLQEKIACLSGRLQSATAGLSSSGVR